jgi:hypothetical protein
VQRWVGWSGRAKSDDTWYGFDPLPWHSPKMRAPSSETWRFESLFLRTSPRPFLAASAFGAAASTYASSMGIIRRHSGGGKVGRNITAPAAGRHCR